MLPISQGYALLILRSKGQRPRSRDMVNYKWFPDYNWLCNQPTVMKLHTHAPHESRMCPIDFEVQRWRSWGNDDWKCFLDWNWLCNQHETVIWNFIHLLPMSQGCALLISGSKGQRSRSWRISVWKRFLDHKWLCNPYPLMIMKLHTPSPYKWRMCLIDFGVQGLWLLGIENSKGCSMLIQRVFATRLYASLIQPLQFTCNFIICIADLIWFAEK